MHAYINADEQTTIYYKQKNSTEPHGFLHFPSLIAWQWYIKTGDLFLPPYTLIPVFSPCLELVTKN